MASAFRYALDREHGIMAFRCALRHLGRWIKVVGRTGVLVPPGTLLKIDAWCGIVA
jgi:hypothetical protein